MVYLIINGGFSSRLESASLHGAGRVSPPPQAAGATREVPPPTMVTVRNIEHPPGKR